MTNADIVFKALLELGSGWHTTRDVMWQVRRDGYQMTTARARGICHVLCRREKASILMDGKRYKFQARAAERPTKRTAREGLS